MELVQLRCFVAVAEELHFGKAARRLDMLPAALGRQVRALEGELGVQLLLRTTRHVALTGEGAELVDEARALLGRAHEIAFRFREGGRRKSATLRLGAIDTASAGLVPRLLRDFREARPDVTIQLVEDKSVRLLPRLLSGRLDLAFVRPPEHRGRELEFVDLFHETPVVAVAAGHRFARRRHLSIADLVDEPLIVPDRRSRPHSHDLTLRLFEKAGMRPAIAQIADEKQTIVRLVASGIGLAIVPRWASKTALAGVRYIPFSDADLEGFRMLPLAVAWTRGTRDPNRDALLSVLTAGLETYRADA